MNYGNRNLVSLDYSFEVDTSNLDTRLDEIEQKITDLGGEDILDEDAVTRIVEGMDYLPRDDAQDFIARDDVDQIVRDLMHSEGEDFVQNVIDNNDYVTASDLDDKISEIGDFATETDLAALDGRIDRVAQRLEDRLAVLEARTSGDGELGQALTFFGLLRQAFAALSR